MSLKIFNDIIALLANALRFYALKYFVGIFVQKEESRWKHVSILYIIGWAWTSAISLLFSSPAMNILSNITSLFLIFFPYRIKKTKKCLAVFVIYVINALVDSIVILSLTKYTMGQPVNQVCECITSFALLFIAIIIQRTTEPIVQMCEMLTGLQVDKNLQEIPLVICDETDELRQLNNAFNELIKNLKLSMEKEMASKVNEIQCQMYALQTQMNPHFIHNILTIISAMSSTSEYEKIPEICEKLSSMIRYNISSSEDFGNLDGEILHAENYLELMKIRYEDKFQYSMSYVGEIQNCHLPKFIIQPLLENCFAHGFRNKEFPWQINIQIYCTEECWEVQIQDNGCGISPQELENLKLELFKMRSRDVRMLMKEMKIGGLSIKNVYIRLYLTYGNHMLFDIQSNPNGTCITVGGNYENTCNGCGR